MDIISFNEASTANSRIESFIENPDSTSGIVTVPKVIASGENITIPAGRVAVLPNVQVDGTLNIEGDVFVPSGATFGDLEKGLMPIGAILNAYTIFDNCIVAFGGEFNRADYPKLWAYLQANPSLVKTQAEWTTENTTNGMCGFYSDGNGTTTFRVPNLDKAFLRPDNRGVASFQGDAIRNITGTMTSMISHSGYTVSGVFTDSNFNGQANWKGSGVGNTGFLDFNASKVVPTAAENRPKNIAVLPLIVAK